MLLLDLGHGITHTAQAVVCTPRAFRSESHCGAIAAASLGINVVRSTGVPGETHERWAHVLVVRDVLLDRLAHSSVVDGWRSLQEE